LDSRLYFYSMNQQRIPSISGELIPEFIQSEEEYQQKILLPMYADIRPFDPKGILQYQWLNSRAAIPKFDQKAIEIRIIDSQECVKADIAIAKVLFTLLKNWHNTSDYYLERPCATKPLKTLFDQVITSGLSTEVDDKELLTQWQLPNRKMTVLELWWHLVEKISTELDHQEQVTIEHILSQGNLSERILKASGAKRDLNSIKQIYKELSDCLLNNEQFTP